MNLQARVARIIALFRSIIDFDWLVVYTAAKKRNYFNLIQDVAAAFERHMASSDFGIGVSQSVQPPVPPAGVARASLTVNLAVRRTLCAQSGRSLLFRSPSGVVPRVAFARPGVVFDDAWAGFLVINAKGGSYAVN